MNASKWALLKISDGDRGATGKQKVYEVRVEGSKVVLEWGMAEKATRQRKIEFYGSEAAARQAATNKVWDKVATGYRIAYSV